MMLNHPFTTSYGTLQNKEFFIIEAIDHDSHRGYGESVAFSRPWYTEETVQTSLHMMEDFLIPLLQQHPVSNPDEVSRLFSPIRGTHMTKGALEGAGWE